MVLLTDQGTNERHPLIREGSEGGGGRGERVHRVKRERERGDTRPDSLFKSKGTTAQEGRGDSTAYRTVLLRRETKYCPYCEIPYSAAPEKCHRLHLIVQWVASRLDRPHWRAKLPLDSFT